MHEPSTVYVQVVPVSDERQIAWDAGRLEQLADRAAELKSAILAGSQALIDALPRLSAESGWRLSSVTGSFGIALAAEAGVILTKLSGEAAIEVTVTFDRKLSGLAE